MADTTTSLLRVVVADDSNDLRAVVSATLRADGRFAIVGETKDGRGAVALVRDLQPDVLLLDLSMPSMDGLAALADVRAAEPDVHVVVLSGLRAGELAPDALALGASAYVEKGVDLAELADVLEIVCRRPDGPAPVLQTAVQAIPVTPSRPAAGGPRRPVATPIDTGAILAARRRRRPRTAFLVLVAFVVAALAWAQAQARTEVRQAFADATAVTAGVVANDLRSQLERIDRASNALLGPTTSIDELTALRGAIGSRGIALVGTDGLVVASTNEAIVGVDLGGREHVAGALSDGSGVSSVQEAASDGALITGAAVRLDDGRVLSTSYDVDDPQLVRQLRDASPPAATTVWLVDAEGGPVARADDRALDDVFGGAPMSALVAGEEIEGWAVESTPVAGSPWRVVAATPDALLLSGVDGVASALPWLLIAFLAAAGVLVLGLHDQTQADAHALQRANDDLGRVNGDLEQFASAAADDLRAPLADVGDAIAGLREQVEGDALASALAETAVAGVERASRLVTELHRFARAGEPSPGGIGEVDLLAVLEHARQDLDDELHLFDATFQLPLEAPAVVADHDQLVGVVTELVHNALAARRHTAPPVVRARVERRGALVVLLLEDNGVGIPHGDRERVFELFERGHASGPDGTGVGLAAVRRALGRWGARIRADEPEGDGAVLRIELRGAPEG